MKERLQKILSVRGICSRRKAEEYIKQGLVKVNGVKAGLGDKADPERDAIDIDGKVLRERQEMLYYVMNKPVGVITSNVKNEKSHIEKTVRDLLPENLQGKIYPVGRLDKDTSGLLLFTNDGVLAYRLTHPSFDHEKEYLVEVTDEIKDGQLLKLQKGITISKKKTKPTMIKRINKSNFTLALTEGRNRQIRRMCQKIGCSVKGLKRIRIMTVSDPDLLPGQVRFLLKKECEELLKAVGLTP